MREKELKELLLKESEEFKKASQMHQKYEKKLEKLKAKSFLTEAEKLEEKEVVGEKIEVEKGDKDVGEVKDGEAERLKKQVKGLNLAKQDLEEKIKLAKETFQMTELEIIVDLIEGDARNYLKNYNNISFCFLDAEKEVYEDCYNLIIPNMVSGGILIADNAINHYETLKPMLDKALTDNRVDAIIVPIGKGELLCRKI